MNSTRVGVTTAAFLALGLTLTAHEDGGPRGDRHRGLVYQSIDMLGATSTNAQGVNARGDIVGAYVKDLVTHGFLISEGVVTTIDYPGAVYTDARGINARGDIVGNYKMGGEPPVNIHGFLRNRHGQFSAVDFPDHAHTNTIAQHITSTGLILGCRHDTDTMTTMRGIVLNARDPSQVAETGAFASMHNGATPDGQVIVGLYTEMETSRGRGYLQYGDTFIPFDVPGSTSTAAWDVNEGGNVVGVYRDATGFHGFLWADLRFEAINYPGATATRAFGINSHGDIVGNFADAKNNVHGFVATRAPRED